MEHPNAVSADKQPNNGVGGGLLPTEKAFVVSMPAAKPFRSVALPAAKVGSERYADVWAVLQTAAESAPQWVPRGRHLSSPGVA